MITRWIEKLQGVCPGAKTVDEAGTTYLLLPNFMLPEGCTPAVVDLLLCPNARDGYSTRLYFSIRVQSKGTPNWNWSGLIIGRSWQAFSFKDVSADLPYFEMLCCHLRGLQ
jgi:hypothetical protein